LGSSWGRGSGWPLRTAWCIISLQPFERNVAKGKRIHGPTPSSPPRRNYEITPRTTRMLQLTLKMHAFLDGYEGERGIK